MGDDAQSRDIVFMREYKDAEDMEETVIGGRRTREGKERVRLQEAIEVVRAQLAREGQEEEEHKEWDDSRTSITVDHQAIDIKSPLLGNKNNIQDTTIDSCQLDYSANINPYTQIPASQSMVSNDIVRQSPATVPIRSQPSREVTTPWGDEICCSCGSCQFTNKGCCMSLAVGCGTGYNFWRKHHSD